MENKIVGQGLAHAVKKVLSLLLSTVMLLTIIAGINLSAYAASGIDYQYELLDNKTVEFTKYTGDDSEFKIPSSIAGYTVTSIGDKAFFSCESLKSVTIPDSIISIGEQAFWGCENLTSVMIPNSVKSIGYWAFGYCENLKSVIIGNSVTSTSESVTSIGESAFWCCYGLKSVTMGNNVTSIGESAFWSCENLASITLSNKLTKIADWMFHGCSSLTSISIPNSVASIGEFAFDSCINLSSITIPNSVRDIGFAAFKYCKSLSSITIPNSVTYIDGAVFSDCLSLANITIPNSVTSIGGIAFENCKSLKSITIPNSVTYIEEKAFTECNALEDVFYKGTLKEWNKIKIEDYNGNLIDATIHCSDGVICMHAWDNGKVTKSATCSTTGVKTYTCTKCKATKTETIAKKAHSYDSGKVTKAATTTATGVKTYTCTKCKATKTETIPKLAVKLSAPTLKVTVNANGTFKMTWNKITGADKYEIYYKQTDGSYKLLKSTTATSYTTVLAQYGKQYSYKMKAVKGSTKSDYSKVVNATNNKKLQTPTLKVTVNSNGTFKMTWNKVTGGTSYQIYYKQADGSYKLLKTVTGTSYTSGFAQYGKQYSYKVRAVTSKNSSATSNYSSVVNATNNKKLQTPTLKVTVNSNGTFKMTWNKVTGATSYQIYYKQADGSYKLLKTVTGTSYTSGFAQYGKQYSYKVRAVTSKNSSATSNYSSVVNAKNTKKLGTPTMKATVNKNGSFKLSWGKVTGATSYQIYWKQANGSYKLLKTVNGTSYTTVVAAKGKTYNYKVRAVTKNNSSATSNYSSVVSAKRK